MDRLAKLEKSRTDNLRREEEFKQGLDMLKEQATSAITNQAVHTVEIEKQLQNLESASKANEEADESREKTFQEKLYQIEKKHALEKGQLEEQIESLQSASKSNEANDEARERAFLERLDHFEEAIKNSAGLEHLNKSLETIKQDLTEKIAEAEKHAEAEMARAEQEEKEKADARDAKFQAALSAFETEEHQKWSAMKMEIADLTIDSQKATEARNKISSAMKEMSQKVHETEQAGAQGISDLSEKLRDAERAMLTKEASLKGKISDLATHEQEMEDRQQSESAELQAQEKDLIVLREKLGKIQRKASAREVTRLKHALSKVEKTLELMKTPKPVDGGSQAQCQIEPSQIGSSSSGVTTSESQAEILLGLEKQVEILLERAASDDERAASPNSSGTESSPRGGARRQFKGIERRCGWMFKSKARSGIFNYIQGTDAQPSNFDARPPFVCQTATPLDQFAKKRGGSVSSETLDSGSWHTTKVSKIMKASSARASRLPALRKLPSTAKRHLY